MALYCSECKCIINRDRVEKLLSIILILLII